MNGRFERQQKDVKKLLFIVAMEGNRCLNQLCLLYTVGYDAIEP
jgi:hypothetical protein